MASLPDATIRKVGEPALQYGDIHRWEWLAFPEDCAQEVRLCIVEYPDLTEAARREIISYRLRKLAFEIWRQPGARSPRSPRGIRPSKLAQRRGYRRNHDI